MPGPIGDSLRDLALDPHPVPGEPPLSHPLPVTEYSAWDIQLARLQRPSIIPCYGYNPRTQTRVGSRHRWQRFGASHTCRWCMRTREQAYQEEAERKARIRKWAHERGL